MIEVPNFKFAVKKGLEDDFVPCQSDPEATGWDVRCAVPDGVTLYPFGHIAIPLGFRMFAPPGWWLELRPRSSSHAKKHLHCLYGVIDETYENELLFSCQFIPPGIQSGQPLTILYGERIGQVVPVKRKTMNVEKISNEEFDRLCLQRSATRKGGLGSTGDK